MICLTANGTVRWTLDIEPVADMILMAVSNIISDRQGDLFYTISWVNKTEHIGKICRITNAQTSSPIQKCIVNDQILFYIDTPLILIEKYDLLITTATRNVVQSAPLAFNKTTLEMFWENGLFLDAGMHGDLRSNYKTGDFFWIGKNDYLVKFNYTGDMFINNSTELGGYGGDFVIDRYEEILVRFWRHKVEFEYKIVVSSYDVSTEKIQLRWNWNPPSTVADNGDITLPMRDEHGTVYMSSMPLVFAIDNDGKTLWTSELATASETSQFALFSYCSAMNEKQRIVYILSGSTYSHVPRLYFITAVHMDTGKIIKRIDLDIGNVDISPKCPVLIGDEMLYFYWFTRDDPKLAPIKVIGLQQVSSSIS